MPPELPGRFVITIVVGALVVAAAIALVAALRREAGLRIWLAEHRMAVLVFALALATPVGEALLALIGTDLFGARNLTASTPGLLLAFGTVLTAAGPVWGGICTVVVVGGFMVGTIKSLEDSARTVDYRAAAALIDDRRSPGDPVVDLLTAPVTPVPLTPLSAHLRDEATVFSLNLPEGDPPFLPLTPKPDPDLLLEQALTVGRDGRVFIVGPEAMVTVVDSERGRYQDGDIDLPAGWQVDSVVSLPGVAELNLYEVSRPGVPADGNRG